MKKLTIALFLIILFGCKKNTVLQQESQDSFINSAKEFLKTQLTETELRSLNWTKAVSYKNNDKVEIIAIPENGSMNRQAAYIFFKNGKIIGNWVSIEKNTVNNDPLSGRIISQSFNRNRLGIINIDFRGRVKGIKIYEDGVLVDQTQNRISVFPVQVPAEIDGPDGVTLYLIQLLGIGQPNWSTNEDLSAPYQYLQPIGDGGSDGIVYVDILFDYSNSGPAIDLQKYFNCFDQIPDNGATYSIKLCTDLPDNNNPDIVAVGVTPGHAFLTMTKTNGSQSATQSFGFYPQSGPLSIFGVAVSSKMVDDGKAGSEHEYNASISMNNISQIDFNAAKNLALSWANSWEYDINDFNCADYALGCFNTARSAVIDVPDSIYPPLNINFGTTPNGIYKKLKAMKDSNHPEAANIQIGVFSAATSHGPCN